jgi:hypothetical protein
MSRQIKVVTPTPPQNAPWMRVPDDVMDERVLRVLLVCVVELRLKEGIKWVYGYDIEAAYRRRFYQPSTLVKPALKRLQEAGKVFGPRQGQPALDLYTIVKEKRR